jgi:hypothetical protein
MLLLKIHRRTKHTVTVVKDTPGTPTTLPVRSTVRMISMLMSLPQTILPKYSIVATAYQNSFIIPVSNVVRLTVPTNR